MAFTIQERMALGIHGLLPAAVRTQDEQLELCRFNLERYTDDLSKYIYLTGLLVRLFRLYYFITPVPVPLAPSFSIEYATFSKPSSFFFFLKR
jgi:hypothetical protein